MVALGILAPPQLPCRFEAQYRMVFAAKNVAPIAALEAAIPDVAALVFASLGIALALHGRQAIRARVLNVGAVGHGARDERHGRRARLPRPRDLGYAPGRDTRWPATRLIGVIRSHAIARQRELREALAGDETAALG